MTEEHGAFFVPSTCPAQQLYAASRAALLRDAVAGRATVIVGSGVAGSGVVDPVYEAANQTGGNVAKRDPTDNGEHREPETLINSPAEDESGGGRDRNSGKRLIFDIRAQITARRRLIR